MQYTVIVHNAEEGGYWVEVPSLLGCFSQGETIKSLLTEPGKSVQLWIKSRDTG